MGMLKSGKQIKEETRAIDEQGLVLFGLGECNLLYRKTTLARAKGSQMDYRFMPEPNLPPMTIDPTWLQIAQSQAQFEPAHLKLIKDFGFPPLFAISVMVNYSL
jgi:Asp-tRNA(Asn)/Glu-tRNA(Gln) amidotransferase B subunit